MKPRLLAVLTVLALSACGTSASLDGDAASGSPSTTKKTLVVASQDYYSNEIIAEAYAQALEAAGFDVQRDLRIGQREVYMPELAEGRIDVFPEYTGNLLQYLDPQAGARTANEVHSALAAAMPTGLRVLEQAPASDQDSYVVAKSFAEEHSLVSIQDLAGVTPLVLGGNSELETRPYGPDGLASVYGVNVSFTPIEDSGGALTVKALREGSIHLADIYSADPVLASGDLVVLEDPKGVFLASHVVPVVSSRVSDEAAAVLNAVSAALDAQDLIAMNERSVSEGLSASVIAADWLAAEGLVP